MSCQQPRLQLRIWVLWQMPTHKIYHQVDGGLGQAGQHVLVMHRFVCHALMMNWPSAMANQATGLVSQKADRCR